MQNTTKNIALYDTTLRDGSQMEGISYSVGEKLEITRKLDELGVTYVEGGWPGSNPKDEEYFRQARDLRLTNATIVAFSSTRRANGATDGDPNLRALLDSEAQVLTLVGKSWDLHVDKVLRTTLDENLRMIADSVSFLRKQGRRVFFDAEHFFDGYHANPDYALSCLRAAVESGAECLALCDTNGGATTEQIAEATRLVRSQFAVDLGIHVHNDCDLAVANSCAAIQVGATQVQATINGYGERCGNANMCSLIPVLKLKYGIDVISDEQLAKLTGISNYVSELANITPNPRQPFTGLNAFTHKAGLHADAVGKVAESYEHIAPDSVGNRSRVLVSELPAAPPSCRRRRSSAFHWVRVTQWPARSCSRSRRWRAAAISMRARKLHSSCCCDASRRATSRPSSWSTSWCWSRSTGVRQRPVG